jgi:hypothetical protein
VQVELGKPVSAFRPKLARRMLNSVTGAKVECHKLNSAAAATGCKKMYQYDNYKLHALRPFPSNLTTDRDMRYARILLNTHRTAQMVEQ